MKAKKLPSGSWRVRVYVRTDKITQPDGSTKDKIVTKSFTVKDPSPAGRRECERMAAEWVANHEEQPVEDLKLGEAIDRYIDSRSSVLSPRTITAYKGIRKTYLQSLKNKKVSEITQDDIQREINIISGNHSPKTVRNVHGLLTAVMRVYRPSFAIRTDMPKPVRPEIYVPSDDEIERLMTCARDTNMELPIMLAAFGPMRRGEISALESSDIDGNVVHVCHNMVKAGRHDWIIKSPKSYAGDRYIEYPDFVARKWKGIEGRIVNLCPDTITKNFEILLKEAGLPHFRFHDLRHYAASIQHAIGIPDAYIMQRGGWGNDSTLKSVYRHTMEEKQGEMSKRTNDYFSKFDTTCHETCHEIEKRP